MKVGFTCGVFDLLHAGHIKMLEDAAGRCDKLIVGLQTDPSVDRPWKNKPVQTLEERCCVLRAIRWVDQVYVYETEEELVELLEAIHPDIRIIGSDWREKEITGGNLGIEIYWHERNHEWSSSELRKRIARAELQKVFML